MFARQSLTVSLRFRLLQESDRRSGGVQVSKQPDLSWMDPHMKKILLSTVALVSLSAGAMAADLPSRRMAPAPFVAAVPVFTWTGFYVGVNAGYGWSENGNDDTITFSSGTFGALTGPGTITFVDGNDDSDGFLGGAQVGFNWQFGSFVVGVEADIQGIDLDRDRGSFDFNFTGPVPAGFRPVRNSASTLDWFGTVRARAGFAIDRVLIYATGGFAYGGGDHHNGCPDGFFDRVECRFDNDDTRSGYAVGGGIEWALPMSGGWFGSSAVTFKVEGLYVNLDDGGNRDERLVGFTAGGTPVIASGAVRHRDDETDFGLVRAGINLKF
jgi:outer membrane immunogenic protein